jgi:acetyltransferase-like isoleucine patch superfamily enzyme
MKFNGRNVSVSPRARIGKNVRIGDNTVIYAGVDIGDDSTICNDVTLGEPTIEYYSEDAYANLPTIVGPGALIRSHSIIYAGCRIGACFSCGHHSLVRENTTFGEHCAVGTMTDIEGEVRIGNYCRLHSNVHIAQTCTLGDFVWFYPFAVMTNDPYPPSNDIRGGSIGDYTQVAVHAIILPGVEVGENCLIGANSVVSKAVPSFSLAMGDPASVVMDLRNYIVMGKGRPYPWMKRFDRGMPWNGMDYEKWFELKSKKSA